MSAMRFLLSPMLLFALTGPAAAGQMPQDVCDKLSRGVTAMGGVFADSAGMARSLDKAEVRAEVGPKTRAAMERLAESRERLEIAIRDYSATAAEASARMRQCSD